MWTFSPSRSAAACRTCSTSGPATRRACIRCWSPARPCGSAGRSTSATRRRAGSAPACSTPPPRPQLPCRCATCACSTRSRPSISGSSRHAISPMRMSCSRRSTFCSTRTAGGRRRCVSSCSTPRGGRISGIQRAMAATKPGPATCRPARPMAARARSGRSEIMPSTPSRIIRSNASGALTVQGSTARPSA